MSDKSSAWAMERAEQMRDEFGHMGDLQLDDLARALDAARLEGLKAAEAAVRDANERGRSYGAWDISVYSCTEAIRSLMTPKED